MTYIFYDVGASEALVPVTMRPAHGSIRFGDLVMFGKHQAELKITDNIVLLKYPPLPGNTNPLVLHAPISSIYEVEEGDRDPWVVAMDMQARRKGRHVIPEHDVEPRRLFDEQRSSFSWFELAEPTKDVWREKVTGVKPTPPPTAAVDHDDFAMIVVFF